MNKKTCKRIAAVAITAALAIPSVASLADVGHGAVKRIVNPATNVSLAYTTPSDNDVKTPEGYNEHDYQQLLKFLEIQDAAAISNGYKLNPAYDPQDPTTWTGVIWVESDDGMRVSDLSLDLTFIEGTLDVSGCTEIRTISCLASMLDEVNVSGCTHLGYLDFSYGGTATKLDVSGCSALKVLYCTMNALKEIDLSDCVSLEELQCGNNEISSLDLSNCTALKEMVCGPNKLTELDVSKNSALEMMTCAGNYLTKLDLSGNKALWFLDCSENQISDLDMGESTAYQYIYCEGNRLTELDVSDYLDLYLLQCNNNQLTTLDTSNCPAKTIICNDNNLSEIYTKDMTVIADGDGYVGMEYEYTTKYSCKLSAVPKEGAEFEGWYDSGELLSNEPDINLDDGEGHIVFDVTSVIAVFSGEADPEPEYNQHDLDALRRFLEIADAGGVKNGTKVNLNYDPNDPLTWGITNIFNEQTVDWVTADGQKRLKSLSLGYLGLCGDLDLSDCTALESAALDSNELTSIKVDGCTELKTLTFDYNMLKEIDVSSNLKLETLVCSYNELTELDVSANKDLEALACNGNKLTKLDIAANTKLVELNGNYNEIEQLDVSNAPELEYLSFSGNKLTKLDVTKNPKLESLFCAGNDLTEIDLSVNKSLKELDLENNILTEIDLSNNSELEMLNVGVNKLTQIDVTHMKDLAMLFCNSNQLTSLNVGGNPKLDFVICDNNKITSLDGNFNMNGTDIRTITANGSGYIGIGFDEELELLYLWESPADGITFEGWFDIAGNKLSSDAEYYVPYGLQGADDVFAKFSDGVDDPTPPPATPTPTPEPPTPTPTQEPVTPTPEPPTPTPPVDETTPGDVDGDGKVTAEDALTVIRNAMELQELTDAQIAAADVDGDGKVTTEDALTIIRIAMNIKGR